MMMQATGARSFIHVLVHYALGALAGLALLGMAVAHAATVKVRPDQAKLVAVVGDPAAVVLGNPMYAEVVVVADKRLLVQGRNPGKTNVIVLDVDGNQLAEFDVVVSGSVPEEIAMFKHGERTTYFCAPECSRVLNVDDALQPSQQLAERVQARDGMIRQSIEASK